MDAKEVAAVLKEIGTIHDIRGENPFKSRSYMNAARTVEGIGADLEAVVRGGTLREYKGIGEALAKKIAELVTSGALDYYEKLRASIPAGLLEMTRIPGMGPKKIKAVHDKLGLSTIGELEYACRENRLAVLEGFGAKSQQKILDGIELLKRFQDKHLYSTGAEQAAGLVEALESLGPRLVTRISVAGSLRRCKEVIKDIDIVASSPRPAKVMDFFTSLDSVEAVIAKGETKSSVRLASGINSDLRLVPDDQFAYALMYLTGSKEHNVAVRTRAKARIYKINEYGLFRGKRSIKCKDEAAIYKKIGLAYIAPELREEMGEIEAAEKGEFPALVEESDIRGILHVHTTHSDGVNTIEQMAKGAKDLGAEYLGIAEHSRSAQYANGLSPQGVKEQQDEIDALNKKLKGIRVLKGIEADILPDGKLDYPNKLLATFDFVIAAVHSRFTMSEADMTERILAAIRNPHVTMLAHPTGRLLLSRDAYPVDMPRIIEEAAGLGIVLEINANPHRLDLDWRLCKVAKEKGVMLAINPDAHRVEGLDHVRYGVGIARKGWLEPSDIFNTRPLGEFMDLLKARRSKAG